MPPQLRCSPHALLRDVSFRDCGQKDHLEGTNVAAFPSLAMLWESATFDPAGLKLE